MEMPPGDYSGGMGPDFMPPGFVEFAEMMVEDQQIPEEAKRVMWGFLNKGTTLGRADFNDRKRAENRFIIMRNMMIMSRPHYEVDIVKIMGFQNAQNRHTTEVNRSINGFERQALTTQIRQVITNRQGGGDAKDAGLFAKAKKMLGFGDNREADET